MHLVGCSWKFGVAASGQLDISDVKCASANSGVLTSTLIYGFRGCKNDRESFYILAGHNERLGTATSPGNFTAIDALMAI